MTDVRSLTEDLLCCEENVEMGSQKLWLPNPPLVQGRPGAGCTVCFGLIFFTYHLVWGLACKVTSPQLKHPAFIFPKPTKLVLPFHLPSQISVSSEVSLRALGYAGEERGLFLLHSANK